MIADNMPKEIVHSFAKEEVTDKQQNFSSSITTDSNEPNKKFKYVKSSTIAAIAVLNIILSPSEALSTNQDNKIPAIIGQQVEDYAPRESIAQELASIRERYERVLFSYPALIIDVQKNGSGDPILASIMVSIDGKDYSIQRSIKQIGFEIDPNMRIIVDGIERGGINKLTFRKPAPVELDDEELAIIRDL